MTEATGIDFVIPWVDGSDPVHRAKRQYYSQSAPHLNISDFEQSYGEQRFIENNELKYCLRSIINHAPWYNKIWLVTDQQSPSFLETQKIADDRIKIIDHKVLFNDQLDVLPVFNTRSILSRLDRIPGLAENVIIGNDDTFFANDVDPEFFFVGKKSRVYAELIAFNDRRFDTLHFDALKLSAKLLHKNPTHYLMMSHGFMPIKMSVFRELRENLSEQFVRNSQHRFRHKSQFLAEALVSQKMIDTDLGLLSRPEKMVHFSFELCRRGDEDKLRFLFSLLQQGQRKMFCLNDFAALSSRFDWILPALIEMSGNPIHSEIYFD